MKVLVVSETPSSFSLKYLTLLVRALAKQHTVSVLAGQPYRAAFPKGVRKVASAQFDYYARSSDEHRFLEVFTLAKKLRIDHIHFCRMSDPQRLSAALSIVPELNTKISFSVFGINEVYTRPIFRKYLAFLSRHTLVGRILIHSNEPRGIATRLRKERIFRMNTISCVHDPIYEDPHAYRISQTIARKRLGLPQGKKIVLYFGQFFFSKGADILLDAARKFSAKDAIFVFAGNTKSANFALARKEFRRNNIILDDRFIPEEEAVSYLRAADVVALPYRRYYKDGTSGLLVQAALAERPVVVPDIFPFNAVMHMYKTGRVFTLESSSALARSLKQALVGGEQGEYARYIAEIESWEKLAEMALK